MNVGEAAKASGVSAKLIRYYESISLIAPAGRTASGYRVYGTDDVRVLQFIRRARKLGFGIEDIAKLVDLWKDQSRASKDVKAIALAHMQQLDARINEMTAMRDTLKDLAEACHGDKRPNCPILKDLESPHACH